MADYRDEAYACKRYQLNKSGDVRCFRRASNEPENLSGTIISLQFANKEKDMPKPIFASILIFLVTTSLA